MASGGSSALGRTRRALGAAGLSALRTVGLSLWKFHADRGFLRASGLAYSTLLSLVPLLALAFALLKGLGIQRRLEPLLLQHLAVGNQEVVARILDYVDRTRVGSLGAVGLVALVLTAVGLIGNVELTLNDIWQVRRGRSPVRKVADYVAILVLGPILLFLSLSLTTSVHAPALAERLKLLGALVPGLVRVLPLVAVWIAFTALYLILPNRRIPLGSAVLGGVVAGTVWHGAEWTYIRFQIGVARYNAIYGALAQLPVLLVWVYVSWCIVLWGAELAYVHHLPRRWRVLRTRGGLWVPRLDAALRLLNEAVVPFCRGEAAPTEADAVAASGLHPGGAAGLVDRLVDVGLLVRTQEDPPRLIPARSPEDTPAALVVERIWRLDESDGPVPERLLRALEREFRGLTWADLARERRP